MEVPVELTRIIINEESEQQLIVLKEKDGERRLPIVIGIVEVFAIDRRLKGIETPRPLTHDLLGNVIEALGARIEKIVVDDLRDHTFFAKLHLHTGIETIVVDSRPSDAIALATATQAPIFVEDRVFEKSGSQ